MRKTRTLQFRVTEEEYANLTAMAETQKVSISTILRRAFIKNENPEIISLVSSEHNLTKKMVW